MRCDVSFPSYVVTLALITLFGMGVENIIIAFYIDLDGRGFVA